LRRLLCGEMGEAEWSGRVGQSSPPPHYRSVLAQSLGMEQPGTVVPDRAWTTSERVLRVAGRRVRQSGGPLDDELAIGGIDRIDVANVAVVDLLIVVVLNLHDLVAGGKGPTEPLHFAITSGVGCGL